MLEKKVDIYIVKKSLKNASKTQRINEKQKKQIKSTHDTHQTIRIIFINDTHSLTPHKKI